MHATPVNVQIETRGETEVRVERLAAERKTDAKGEGETGESHRGCCEL